MIERITPEMVEAACKKTSLQLVRGFYVSSDGHHACPMGVVGAAHTGVPDGRSWGAWNGDILRFLNDNLRPKYGRGFWQGFDGLGADPSSWFDDSESLEAYRDGYEDGRTCAEKLLNVS
jgi:hypothetical protein